MVPTHYSGVCITRITHCISHTGVFKNYDFPFFPPNYSTQRKSREAKKKCVQKVPTYKMELDFWHQVQKYNSFNAMVVFVCINRCESEEKFCHNATAFNGTERCESIINVIHIPKMQLRVCASVHPNRSVTHPARPTEMHAVLFAKRWMSNNEWKYDKCTTHPSWCRTYKYKYKHTDKQHWRQEKMLCPTQHIGISILKASCKTVYSLSPRWIHSAT